MFVSRVRPRRGLPERATGPGRGSRIPKNPRPSRAVVELCDRGAGPSRPCSRQRHTRRHCQSESRVSGFPYAVEGCRPKYSHLGASEGGVREAEVTLSYLSYLLLVEAIFW